MSNQQVMDHLQQQNPDAMQEMQMEGEGMQEDESKCNDP